MATSDTDLVTAKGLRNVAGEIEGKIASGGGVVLARTNPDTSLNNGAAISLNGSIADFDLISVLAKFPAGLSFKGELAAVRADIIAPTTGANYSLGGSSNTTVNFTSQTSAKVDHSGGYPTYGVVIIGYKFTD